MTSGQVNYVLGLAWKSLTTLITIEHIGCVIEVDFYACLFEDKNLLFCCNLITISDLSDFFFKLPQSLRELFLELEINTLLHRILPY